MSRALRRSQPIRQGGLAVAILFLSWACEPRSSDHPPPGDTADGSGRGESESDAGSRDGSFDVGDDPVRCSSGLTWADGNEASTRMKPGSACLSCHVTKPGVPPFAIAGTVYPTLHEPDDCYGTPRSGQVEITDSENRVLLLPVNSAGNFIQFASESVVPPFRARILFDGGQRSMKQPQMSGDCNSCHTQFGASGAPGRIVAR